MVVAADDVRSADVQAAIEQLLTDVGAAIQPGEVINPYSDDGAHQISDNYTVAYAELNLDDRDSDEYKEIAEEVRSLVAEADRHPARAGRRHLRRRPEFSSEAIGFLAAIVILLIAFGSVLAMGLPIITAYFGIVTGISIVGLVVHLMNMSSFTAASVAMLLDATVIRMVLVPVTMELLGNRNWWLPRWLDRILPTVHVEPPDPEPADVPELIV